MVVGVSSARGIRLDLASKINFLFREIHPSDRGSYSLDEVAKGIEEETGEMVSRNTLWKLRTGRSDNPTMRTLQGIAAFFGVSPGYFFNDTNGSVSTGEDEPMNTFFKLSPEARQKIGALIEYIARLECRSK
jgi:transcriptional regulator with XRE-family HTH domain